MSRLPRIVLGPVLWLALAGAVPAADHPEIPQSYLQAEVKYGRNLRNCHVHKRYIEKGEPRVRLTIWKCGVVGGRTYTVGRAFLYEEGVGDWVPMLDHLVEDE